MIANFYVSSFFLSRGASSTNLTISSLVNQKMRPSFRILVGSTLPKHSNISLVFNFTVVYYSVFRYGVTYC